MSIRIGIQDIIAGAKEWQFWMTFGMNDIKAKYRRSKLGQLWITLSVAFFIIVIGGLYRGIFDADENTYLAYLAVGYILWLFIQDSINMGCMILVQAKPFMLQKQWPISVFVFRNIYRDVLTFAHHAILLPPIFIWLGLWPGLSGILFALIGFAFIVFTAFWVALLVAIISLRYRDFPPITLSIMRMAFFATPVIWMERNLGNFGELVVLLNPFGYYLKIVRDPLIGLGFPAAAWGTALGLTFVTMLIAILTLSATKSKLSYWL